MVEQRLERRLSAILATDIAGYSRLMGEDEARTVRDLMGTRQSYFPWSAILAGASLTLLATAFLPNSQAW
jgi:hypothetical protein